MAGIARVVTIVVVLTLPLSPWLALRVGSGSAAIRYGCEAAVDLVALAILLTRPRRCGRVLAPVLVPLACLVAFWLATDVWNEVSPQTAVVALRGDLRFVGLLPLVAIAGAGRDRRLYVRALLASAALQSLLALAHVVHASFLQTTLGDYNQLGVLLLLALVTLATGAADLSRLATWGTGVLLALGIVASTSREAALGTALGLGVVAFIRGGRRTRWALAGATAAGVLLMLVPTLAGTGSGYLDATGPTARWHELLTANFSPQTNFRSELLIDNAKQVAAHSPVVGFGFGTASAPRVIEDLSSPVYRSFLRFDLKQSIEPFVYDSNWAIIVLETGFLGCAVLVLFLAQLCRLGLASRSVSGGVGEALAAAVVALALVSFASPALREPPASLVLWLLVGLTLAQRAARRG